MHMHQSLKMHRSLANFTDLSVTHRQFKSNLKLPFLFEKVRRAGVLAWNFKYTTFLLLVFMYSLFPTGAKRWLITFHSLRDDG